MKFKKLLLITGLTTAATLSVTAQKAPEPCGLTPSARQIEWYNREIIAFFHFGINTFEDFVNEGDGKAPTAIFNPTTLDCGQWMQTLKSAGIPSAILTAKHADGFCLWPSKYTDYCVKNSAWKGGKGDVVREFVDACEEYGIKAGIYLGPHDRHEHLHPQYNTEKYMHYYAAQLEELMGDYGKIWETWWDGAGADELTTPIYTHWYKIVREKQPDCVIFGTKNSYPFADVRWMGNEAGEAGDPCWATTDSIAIRDEAAYYQGLNEGVYDGNAYVPAETDVSIRPSSVLPSGGRQARENRERVVGYLLHIGRAQQCTVAQPSTRPPGTAPLERFTARGFAESGHPRNVRKESAGRQPRQCHQQPGQQVRCPIPDGQRQADLLCRT